MEIQRGLASAQMAVVGICLWLLLMLAVLIYAPGRGEWAGGMGLGSLFMLVALAMVPIHMVLKVFRRARSVPLSSHGWLPRQWGPAGLFCCG